MKKFLHVMLSLLLLIPFFGNAVKANETEIELYSEYAIVINIKDDRIMYQKNIHEKMYPASMTKMMSVLVAIENIEDMSKTYTIESEVLEGLEEANASVAGFDEGDVVTYEDLLYGIMLPSGADASRAIAFTLFGSEEGFVKKMNEKAKALKMKNTHFVNTSGLHDEDHYTTVSDLSLLLRYALKNKDFKKIFTTHKYVTSNKALTFTSTFSKQKQSVDLDTSMIQGTKTGFTYPASLCLASYAKVDKEEYIAITGQTHSLNTYPYHIVDAVNLYNYFYGNYSRTTILKKDELFVEIPIQYGFEESYPLYASKKIALLCKSKDNVEIIFDGVEYIETPMKKDTYLGQLILVEDGQQLYKEKFYLEERISRNYFTYYFHNPLIFLKHMIPIVFIVGILYMGLKKRGYDFKDLKTLKKRIR